MTIRTITSPTHSPIKEAFGAFNPQECNEKYEIITKTKRKAQDLFNIENFNPSPTTKKIKLTTDEEKRGILEPKVLFELPESSQETVEKVDLFSTQQLKTPTRRAPPPTPQKKTSSPVSPFQIQHQQTEAGTFSFHGMTYQISKLGQGSFATAYVLKNNAPQIQSGVDNSNLVVKIFHGINSGFHPRALRSYLTSSIQNYAQVTSLNLPVATIYNAETALSDLAIIQEKVDADIDLNNPAHMAQVKHFLDTSIQSGVLMDLQPSNFKVRGDTVVLIDFIEELNEHNISTMVTLAMKAFVRLCKGKGLTPKQIDAHVEQLTAGFEEREPYFNADWRKDLLNG